MPLVATRGAASSQGFGEFAQGAQPLYIEDVFSTWLYTGNSSTQTINNGIDLAGKGGLVWIKGRSSPYSHALFDTNRGANNYISTNATNSQNIFGSFSNLVTSFNSNGFSLGSDQDLGWVNYSGNYTSWTFREAPKFFDVVTYTGNGIAGRQIPHTLGVAPGFIIVKCTNVARDWAVWHRTLADGTYLKLNTTDSVITNTSFQVFGDASGQTSSVFTVGKTGSGVNGLTNANTAGDEYVAYLFAHDPSADGVIQCGSYTGNGSTSGPTVTLGYEPQWLLVKNATTGGVGNNWIILDNMRGLTVGGNDAILRANLSDAEVTSVDIASPTATGFQITSSDGSVNASGSTYIYIAIRRGPMRTPTSGTQVYYSPGSYSDANNQSQTFGMPYADLAILRYPYYNSSGSPVSGPFNFYDRLRGGSLGLNSTSTSAETSAPQALYVTNMSPVQNNLVGTSTPATGTDGDFWFLRRAPGFFDVTITPSSYTGIAYHNLTVPPELIIEKQRASSGGWRVFHKDISNTGLLNTTGAFDQSLYPRNPTATTFEPWQTNTVAYLFASCPGVSKVGSYTGTGTTQQINCGFAAGARFVLIKRTDSTGDWYLWDTARGIVSGNDPYLLLNSTAAEVTSTDYIDPYSAGFEISSTAPAAINASGGSFIFLAIA